MSRKSRAGKGVMSRQMDGQAARVAKKSADYQSLDHAAKDFVSLNSGLDCNDPENLERAWKNFNDPSQKLRKFVFTPTLSSTNSRTLRVFLFALIAANMVTAVNAEAFQESLGGNLIGGEDSVPPKSSAPLPPPVPARIRGGNLRGIRPAHTPLSSHEPAARELPANPQITQSQLLDYVNAQRDPANPEKMISLAALTETFATDDDGLLALPHLVQYSASNPKLPLRNIDFTSARLRSAYFENADLSGSKMTGKDLGSSFRLKNCDLSKTDFDHTSGSIRISGTSDCSGASFQGARFAQRFGVVYPGEEVTGLDLTGATVTVLDYDGVATETISATSPLVVARDSEKILKVAAVPGMALQVGAADRPIEVELKSDAERCPTDDGRSVVPSLKLEEFAKTLNGWFRGYNIAATTNSSKADGASVVRSEINLCESPDVTSSSANFFPQLSTRILLRKDLSPEHQQLAVTESVFRAFGVSPDASYIRDLTYKMYKETWPNPELPPQSPGYLPAMIHKYFEEFAGRDPALAGCTLSVGLNPGEFKVVAGNVEMVVNPKICDKENEFGFTCHFNQRAVAISNRMRVEDMSVSLNTIEKDGEVVGYVMAVDGMKKVAGVATTDEMRCPEPPTPIPPAPPTPQRRRDETDMGLFFGTLVGSVVACVCCCCIALECSASRRAERRRMLGIPQAAEAAIGMPPLPLAVDAVAVQPAAEGAIVEAIFVNPDGSAAMAIANGREEEVKVAADGNIVRAPHAVPAAPGRNNHGI